MAVKCYVCCTFNQIQVLRPTGNGRYITMGDIYDAVLRLRQQHREICLLPTCKSMVVIDFCGIVSAKGTSDVETESLWARRRSVKKVMKD